MNSYCNFGLKNIYDYSDGNDDDDNEKYCKYCKITYYPDHCCKCKMLHYQHCCDCKVSYYYSHCCECKVSDFQYHCCKCKKNYAKDHHCCECKMGYYRAEIHCCRCKENYNNVLDYHCCMHYDLTWDYCPCYKIYNWYKQCRRMRILWKIAEYYTQKKYSPENVLKFVNLED